MFNRRGFLVKFGHLDRVADMLAITLIRENKVPLAGAQLKDFNDLDLED